MCVLDTELKMSFFIRNKGKASLPNGGKAKRKKTFVAYPKESKKQAPRITANDEITSDEDDLSNEEHQYQEVIDEDELETAQEKKLKLAKKYLEEIEKEERERRDSKQVDDDTVLNRLKEDVLQEEGRLRRFVSQSIKDHITEEEVITLRCKEHKLAITCVVVSSDSKFIYSASKDASIVKWSLTDKRKLKSIPPFHKNKSNPNLHSSSILSLAISFDGKYLASGDEGKIIRIWNGDSLDFMFNFVGHRGAVTGLSFCRFTQNLYSSSHDKTVRVWSIPDRAYIETLFGHQDRITSLDTLSKGKVVTSGGTDNTVRLWKIEEESQLIYNGKLLNIDYVTKLNERNFISCGQDGCISLWSMFKKKPIYSIVNAHGINNLSGEPNWIVCVGALQNTEIFASGSCDGFLRIWKCDNTFKSISQQLEVPTKGFINSISFSNDEKYVIVGVGQEHRLGRWLKIKEARNSLLLINLEKKHS